ncbi:uncharacterized protein LOC119394697 [Rhipicephalus sanguineus]|uniref:uncharacterized protein LOC119394697 n=1 Tax=Rhipicephalus sanguineus TaxID=34632 RepID=UPI0018938EE3|nr:uncharacterized protein LOC119394697 [Rhipicephalus sanguineus]
MSLAVCFNDLLFKYLESTVINHNDNFYVQKAGICIGSRVAPVLSDLLLAQFDRGLEASGLPNVVKIFRFVGDFLVLFKRTTEKATQEIEDFFSRFCKAFPGLTLTKELPEDGRIRFLDLELHFTPGHACWIYASRSRKRLLPYASNNSKLVKRAVALAAMNNALMGSCSHQIPQSLASQINRLKAAGFPEFLLCDLAETLLRKLKKTSDVPRKNTDKTKTAVIPDVHQVSHRIKKAAGRAGVRVVFAPNKLGGLCKRVNPNVNVLPSKHSNPPREDQGMRLRYLDSPPPHASTSTA